ncbi:MAG: Do family serine endopeptidase [Candidatus Didemnitutus sp.]|nr:Do family serine endopeptidase [Candidatus Didemnitutus sp.]
MKAKAFVLSLCVGLAAGLITLSAQTKPAVAKGAKASATKSELKHPDLKLDTTPVGEGKAPVLTSYADVLTDVRPAVVSVYSSKIVRQRVPEFYRQLFGNIPDREQKLSGLGSGVIISPDGYILTNNHVVEDADELKVALSDDRELPAKLIGTDPKTDVAVIKVDADKLPHVTIADSDRLRVGDVVFAIGNPLGIGQTVTMGIVSATGRKNVNLLTDREPDAYEDFIQTDAAINMGNSGGALIDAKGRLVGINSGIATTNRGNIGIGFAIPINLARSVMTSLIETGTVVRGYLGVSSETLTAEVAESLGLPRETRGVVITDLSPKDGPAAKAGLKREDIVTAVNGRAIASRDDLRLTIAQTLPGTKVRIDFLRDGKPQNAEVTLGKLEDTGADGEFLPGVVVQQLNNDLRGELRIPNEVEGLVITDIAPTSPFGDVFPVGAVIEQINRVPVADVASAKRALREGRNLALIYYRGNYRYVGFVQR